MIRVTAAQRHDLQGNPNQFYIQDGENYLATLFDLEYSGIEDFASTLRELADKIEATKARRVNRSQEIEA